MTGNDELDALLAAAAAPAVGDELDENELEVVLATFTAAGAATTTTDGRRRARRPWFTARPTRLAVRSAVAIFAVAASGIAVASAGILPTPMQSFAHNMLHGVGVPGPSDASPPAAASAPPVVSITSTLPPSQFTERPTATPHSSVTADGQGGGSTIRPASMLDLCGRVAADPKGWQSTMSAADRQRLITVAGKVNKVKHYCETLIAGAAHNGGAPTVGSTGTSSSNSQGNGNGNGNGGGSGKGKASGGATSSSSPTASATADSGNQNQQ
ncbi:MAG: hypothetical protein ACRDVE_00855 [Actinocrinis sp.]